MSFFLPKAFDKEHTKSDSLSTDAFAKLVVLMESQVIIQKMQWFIKYQYAEVKGISGLEIYQFVIIDALLG